MASPARNHIMLRCLGLLIVAILLTSGCATFSKLKDLGPAYEPDQVDQFHAQTMGLRAEIRKMGERITQLRQRIGSVVNGNVSFESIRGDVQNIKQMVGTIKRIPARVQKLLTTAQQMLVDAPSRYLGPNALHLPKKVKLIKEAIVTLKELPVSCKDVLLEGVALAKCVGGLTSGSTAQCDAGKLVARAKVDRKYPVKGSIGNAKRGKTSSADGSRSELPQSGWINPYPGQARTAKRKKTSKVDGSRSETIRPDFIRPDFKRGSLSTRARETGGLLIKSRPQGAKVVIDGRTLPGVTPMTAMNLRPGKHNLYLRKGVAVYRGTVRVKSEKYRTVDLVLTRPRGRLEIVSQPAEAWIFLDGKEIGKTPKFVSDITAGEHTLSLVRKGYVTKKMKFFLDLESLRKRVKVKLIRAGYIVVRSNPSGALVVLDGQERGKTPTKLALAPGRHIVSLTLDGRVPFKRRLRVRAGGKTKVRARLRLTRLEKRRLAAIAAKRRAEERTEKLAAAEEKRRAEEEARRQELAVKKRRAEEEIEAKRRSEEQERRKALAESKRKQQETARKRAVAEAKQRKLAEARERAAADAARTHEEARAVAAARERYKKAMADHDRKAAPLKSHRRKKSIVAYTTLGVGLACMATAGILYGVGQSNGVDAYQKYSDARVQAEINQYRSELDSAEALLVSGHVLVGVGAVAIGFSIYSLVTRPDVPEPPAKVGNRLMPGVFHTKDLTGFSLSGRF